MLKVRNLAGLALAVLTLVTGGCTDRAPISEPTAIGSGPYVLGPGDRLRIVVYDQPSLSNIYEIDQQGLVSMPLISNVVASDSTTDALARRIEAKLGSAYLRNPNVTVEVASYRPFFVLGEVRSPGQFPYVPGITAETGIAVAGGFTDRANKRVVRLSRKVGGKLVESRIPVIEAIRPGDTIYVTESLF